MDYKNFEKWFDEYKKRGGFYPKDTKRWFETVLKEREGLREKLGGYIKSFQLNTSLESIFTTEHETFAKEIQTICPGIFNKICKTNLKNKQTRVGHRNMSVSKYIVNGIEDKTKHKEIGDIMARVGQLNERLAKDNFISISLSPYHVVKIGDYKVDDGSCWKQGANYNEKYKYNFGILPNSFVWIVHKGKITEESTDIDACGRGMGCLIDNNLYFFNGKGNGYIQAKYDEFTKDIRKVLGVKKDNYNSRVCFGLSGGIGYIDPPSVCYDDNPSSVLKTIPIPIFQDKK